MSIRLDKWLWAARFFKTRSLAQKAIEGGKVHVDGQRVKPGRPVQTGQLMRIRNGTVVKEVVVLELSDKRGPASHAQSLYEETPESIKQREKDARERKVASQTEPRFETKPDKRQRRQIEKLLRQNRYF